MLDDDDYFRPYRPSMIDDDHDDDEPAPIMVGCVTAGLMTLGFAALVVVVLRILGTIH